MTWLTLFLSAWLLATADLNPVTAAVVAGGATATWWWASRPPPPREATLLSSPIGPHRRFGVAHQITTSKPQHKQVTFYIDDDEFTFTCPKIAGAMSPLLDPRSNGDGDSNLTMTKAAWEWLYTGLPADQYDHLMARLNDEDDGLDIPDVAEVVRHLMGEATGRPTGSRSG